MTASPSPPASLSSSSSTILLPRIGLGMAALGRPGYINLGRDTIFGDGGGSFSEKGSSRQRRDVSTMQNQANSVMDTLFDFCSADSGGNTSTTTKTKTMMTMMQRPWLDCARSYGLSEKFVGEYLRKNNIQPNEVYVSSKWGYSKYYMHVQEKKTESGRKNKNESYHIVKSITINLTRISVFI